MFVLSKDGQSLVNMAQVSRVFTTSNRICVTFKGETGCQLGEYDYSLRATVMEMLTNAIRAGSDVFYMPSDATARLFAETSESHGHREQHTANGAVIKRRGGS